MAFMPLAVPLFEGPVLFCALLFEQRVVKIVHKEIRRNVKRVFIKRDLLVKNAN